MNLVLLVLTVACGATGDPEGGHPRRAAAAAAPSGPLAIWVAPSLSRIMKTASPGELKAASLYAGKGEYEAFQIGIRGPLTNVKATASALTGPGRATIAASHIELFAERYVNIKVNTHYDYDTAGGVYAPGPIGWYPDGLLPFKRADGTVNQLATPFDVASGENQVIWVDVFVPRGTTAGTYKGKITVTADQGAQAVPVTVTVWDFTLPLSPSLKTSFNLHDARRRSKAHHEILLKHRLTPGHFYPSSWIASFQTTWGLTNAQLDGVFSGPKDENRATLSSPPSVSHLQSIIRRYPSNLPLNVFVADEPRNPRLAPAICSWARSLHGTRAKSLAAIWPWSSLLDDGGGSGKSCVDIWVLAPRFFHGSQARNLPAVRAKGDEIWAYTALNHDAYSPKWHIDYGLPDYRIWTGFMAHAADYTGVLYWAVDFEWDSAQDLWTDPYWHRAEGPLAGAGLLILPMPDARARATAEPCPTIRLKWLRDGVEDYEYIQLLKAKGETSFVNSTAASVATSWRTWSKDPAALEAARMRLGEKLQQLTR